MDAIKNAPGSIPIVLLTGDPSGGDIRRQPIRPGGQITGVALMAGSGGLAGKRVELLKDALLKQRPAWG